MSDNLGGYRLLPSEKPHTEHFPFTATQRPIRRVVGFALNSVWLCEALPFSKHRLDHRRVVHSGADQAFAVALNGGAHPGILLEDGAFQPVFLLERIHETIVRSQIGANRNNTHYGGAVADRITCLERKLACSRFLDGARGLAGQGFADVRLSCNVVSRGGIMTTCDDDP